MFSRLPGVLITQCRFHSSKRLNVHPKQIKGVRIKQTKTEDLRSHYKQHKEEITRAEEYQNDPEGFGDVESDFMELHKSHKRFERERKAHREEIQRYIVRDKYFSKKQPNFLTYSEKQQIRLLNAKDPEEWNTEKLSECFPADPITISKLIKAKWNATSEERIRKHDERVIENWNLFKKGDLVVENYLKEHLQKFTDRTVEDLKTNQIDPPVKPQMPVPNSSEFSSIVRCESGTDQKMIEQGKKPETTVSSPSNFAREDETFLIGEIVDKRRMRLQDLKGRNVVSNVEKEESTALESPKEVKEIPTDVENISSKDIQKFAYEENTPREISISQEDMKKFEISTVKERIYIPRRLRKPGGTYKVEDCYYDDDGEFLYRVPGMKGVR